MSGIAFFALLGLGLGTLVNWLADRLPRNHPEAVNLVSCPHWRNPSDFVPILGYALRKGRCPNCGRALGWRRPAVDIVSGAILGLSFWQFGLSTQFALTAFWGIVFLLIAVIDFEHTLILNATTYPLIILALILSIFLPVEIPGMVFPWPVQVNGLVGAATGFILLFLIALVSRGGMGWGDVKAAALIGMVTGFPLLLVALFLGVVLGGLVAALLLITRIRKRKDAIPFGPFLSVGTLVTLFAGVPILAWYLHPK